MADQFGSRATNAKAATAYSTGLVHMSVCTPDDWTKEDVELWAKTFHDTGIDSPWKVVDERFATGEPNPTPCDQPEHMHWLLTC